MKVVLEKIGQDPDWSNAEEFAAFLREESDSGAKSSRPPG